MITGKYCQYCGSRFESTIKGECLLWGCAPCENVVVTTYWAPVEADTQRYKVFVKKNDRPDIEYLRIISRATGLNYLEIKKSALDADVLIFEGEALAVLLFKEELKKSSLDFYITPDFIYTNEDLDELLSRKAISLRTLNLIK